MSSEERGSKFSPKREVDYFLIEVGLPIARPDLFKLFETDFKAEKGKLIVYASPNAYKQIEKALGGKKLASKHFPDVEITWPVIRTWEYDELTFL
jgi:hypothetical protein